MNGVLAVPVDALFQLFQHAFQVASSRAVHQSVAVTVIAILNLLTRGQRHAVLNVLESRLHRGQDVSVVVPAELTPTGGERETGSVVHVRGPVEDTAGPQEEEYHRRQDVVRGQWAR